ncbi:MAG: potassium transporter Kup [Bauldia sp.]
MATTLPIPAGERPKADGNTSGFLSTRFLTLALGSIGVVYGDIGTSPLYAFREAARAAAAGGAVTATEVFGVLSLIFWSLIIVVTLKYVLILLRADNNGEGGTLALMALAHRALPRSGLIVLAGVIAAALFYGDAVITPALSVLSAVEGLAVLWPASSHLVLPISIAILVLLFLGQYRGTATISALFWPITLVWFLALAILGIMNIAASPAVLLALSPTYAASFLFSHGIIGLITLGAVFLAVTGAEALYADMGHFGRRPVQVAWLVVVMPCLVLNYFGQGAMVLARPETMENPFFLMAPGWAQLPMIVLATAATVIASQAVISGAYSLSRQAVQLGLLPRLEVRYTSEAEAGQIYMPQINLLLLVGVLLLVGIFKTSGALASAYGIAVTGTMVVTTLLAIVVVSRVWKWGLAGALALVVPFLVIDLVFLGANLLKVVEGGWFPLLLGGILVVCMLTWRRGTAIVFAKTRRLEVPLPELIASLEKKMPPRVSGTAVYLTSDRESSPTALLHALKHFKVLHEHNMILTVVTADTPRVKEDELVTLEWLGPSFARMTARFGFAESPNIPRALAAARRLGWEFDIMSTSFFLSRRSVRAAAKSAMPRWQDQVFIALSRNADDASRFFRIPTDRVVEIGAQMAL